MNRFLLTLLAFVFTATAFSQNVVNPFPRTINVNGSAEMEIVPDQIFVHVTLKEYQKKGQAKVNIDKIRQEFVKNFRSLGLPDSTITVLSYDGMNENPWLARKKKKDETLLASITYEIMLRSTKQMDDLVALMDDNATESFDIVRTSHSRIEEFRRQLKIKAVQAAREKAIYLAGAVNEKVGPAITINEPGESYMPMYNYKASNTAVMRNQSLEIADEAPAVDFKKIKFRYEVNATFALQ